MNYFIIFTGAYGRKVYCVDLDNCNQITEAWKKQQDIISFYSLLLPSNKSSLVSIKTVNTSMIEVRVAD